MRNRILMFASVVLTASCSSMTPVGPTAVTTQHVVQRNFSVGELKSASVGEAMVSVKDYYQSTTQRNAWSIPDPIKVHLAVGYVVPVPGDYPVAGRTEIDGSTYDVINVNVHPLELLTLSPSPTVIPYVLLVDQTGQIRRVGGGMGITSPVGSIEPADFKAKRLQKTSIDSAKGYTNFELIYTGLSGGVLRITYREYSPDDLARTAFFQDLTYNLADKTIRFKNILIDVESADNQAIRFRVKSVPQEWMSAAQP